MQKATATDWVFVAMSWSKHLGWLKPQYEYLILEGFAIIASRFLLVSTTSQFEVLIYFATSQFEVLGGQVGKLSY